MILELRGEKRSAYLVGFDTTLGGGPWRLTAGRDVMADDDAVVDRALARRYEMNVGDTFDLMGRRFTIVGLSEGTTSWMTSFSVVRKSAAESLFSAPGTTSLLLVTASDGTTGADLRERLGALPGMVALPKDEIAANDATVFSKVIGPAHAVRRGAGAGAHRHRRRGGARVALAAAEARLVMELRPRFLARSSSRARWRSPWPPRRSWRCSPSCSPRG